MPAQPQSPPRSYDCQADTQTIKSVSMDVALCEVVQAEATRLGISFSETVRRALVRAYRKASPARPRRVRPTA